MDDVAKKSVSADSVRFFHESIAAAERGDMHMSYQLLLASLGEDYNLPGSWQNLGCRLHEQKRFAPAAAAFYKALSFAPDAILPKANYAWNLHHTGRDEEALALMLDVTARDPGMAQHWVNLSQIRLSMNAIPEALEAAQRAVDLSPKDPMPNLSLSLAQLRAGDYETGLKNYAARFPYIPVLKEFLNYPYPMWNGQDIDGKRLFIAAEQGLGDSVMFMRFIPEAIRRASHTTVLVHDNCLKLFKRNLTGKVDIYPLPHELPAADVFCPLLSLPVGLGLTNEKIKNSYWQYKTSFSPCNVKTKWRKIGICWAGDANHDNDRNRSATLEDFLPLAELPDTQLYSLQVGPRRADVDTVGSHAIVRDMSAYFKTVSDTAAFIRHELDAVVTVDTAVAHIAGSVGVKTYLLIGKKAIDWRWGTAEGPTCWYPNTEMLLQKEAGNWREVIERARGAISSVWQSS